MDQLLEIINIINDNKGNKILNYLENNIDLRVDLGYDSLDLAELTVRCEQAFGVDIFETGIVTSVKDVLDRIRG